MEADKKEQRKYWFQICPTCGKKIHKDSRTCHSCGGLSDRNEKTGEVFSRSIVCSLNPADAIYSTELNSVHYCMKCERALSGHPCKFAFYGGPCFATALGVARKELCDSRCRHDHYARYECCQRIYRENPPPLLEDVLKVLEEFEQRRKFV
jgi:hypothetical protein